MAVGKNKRVGKKGGKKRIGDPFAKKEWFNIKAPNPFRNKNVGWTPINKTQGTHIASEALKGRVVEASLADLQKDEDQGHKKMYLRVEEVVGVNAFTNFYGMDLTADRYRSLVRKWQSLIETNVEVKTLDGYVLRIFVLAFTKKRQNQLRKTSYAQTRQAKLIRKKMTDIVTHESNVELKDLVNKFIPDAIAMAISKECKKIYPLQNVYIRKVKVLKAPKVDTQKLLDLHGEGSNTAAPLLASTPAPATEDTGATVTQPAETKQ